MVAFSSRAEPDYVYGLDSVIRARTKRQSFPATRGLRMFGVDAFDNEPLDEEVSADAIGAAVRATFSDVGFDPQEDVVEVVTGALLSAMAVANVSPSLGGTPMVINPLEAEVTAPWNVAHPVLLDPVLWMIGAAVEDVRR
jgi:hypothetical protein